MLISASGRQKIKAREALKLTSYVDSGGVQTIGWGHVEGVKPGQSITEAQAEAYFDYDVANAEAAIIRFTTQLIRSEIPQAAMDALVSFTFNLGVQGWLNKSSCTATGLSRAVNEQRWRDVPHELLRWKYDNGYVVEGLLNRRKKEAADWCAAFNIPMPEI